MKIVYGHPIPEKDTWQISSISFPEYSRISIVVQQGMRVERIAMTVEKAEEIGLVNWDALLPYVKNIKP